MAGSSYSYAYATLGEIVAWFIGWNMVLEYGVSASAVAVSWTGYFTSLLDHLGLHIPEILTNAPLAFTDNHLVTTLLKITRRAWEAAGTPIEFGEDTVASFALKIS